MKKITILFLLISSFAQAQSLTIFSDSIKWHYRTVGPIKVNFLLIEGTEVQSGDFVVLKSKSDAVIDFSQFTYFYITIRSKATWVGGGSELRLRWFDEFGDRIGNEVDLKQNSYDFNSSNTNEWQTIRIPISQFGNLDGAVKLKLEASLFAGFPFGWYISNISLINDRGDSSTVAKAH
jgi:hypothetical protein